MALLDSALQDITSISDTLTVFSNPTLVSLAGLRNLTSAGAVYIVGNDMLQNALMPQLNRLTPVVVDSNRRLCPELYPFGSGSCVQTIVKGTFVITGYNMATFSAAEQAQMCSSLALYLQISATQVLL